MGSTFSGLGSWTEWKGESELSTNVFSLILLTGDALCPAVSSSCYPAFPTKADCTFKRRAQIHLPYAAPVRSTVNSLTHNWRSICPSIFPSHWVSSLNSGLDTGQAGGPEIWNRDCDSHQFTPAHGPPWNKALSHPCIPPHLSVCHCHHFLILPRQGRDPQHSVSKRTRVPGLQGGGQPRTAEKRRWNEHSEV